VNILITGGAGFIGSHLAGKLLAEGHDVVVIDDLSTGNKNNIVHYVGNNHFMFHAGSVRDLYVMSPLVEQCDIVYHLAAAVGVQLILDKPVHTIETNIHGTEIVLQLANQYKKKVLIASSSEVYGKSEQIPFSEDGDMVLGATRHSRWAYACSKAIDEFLSFAYTEQYGLEVVITRFFNVIGPRQTGQYGMVVPRFVAKALKNEPLEIYGSGDQARCFGYIDDVIEAITTLVASNDAYGKVFNIGATSEISMTDLAKKIIEMTGSKSEMRYLTYEEAYGKTFDDMLRRVPCLEKISKAIGFSPKVTLDQALTHVINDMKTRLN
jgi:UDP-glucose 4-epimerase